MHKKKEDFSFALYSSALARTWLALLYSPVLSRAVSGVTAVAACWHCTRQILRGLSLSRLMRLCLLHTISPFTVNCILYCILLFSAEQFLACHCCCRVFALYATNSQRAVFVTSTSLSVPAPHDFAVHSKFGHSVLTRSYY